MTATLGEARSLIAIAEEKRLVVQVGHIERFNPVLDGFDPAAVGATYIEARRYTPFTGRSTDTSVVFDLMVHDLDLVCWMAGSRPVAVEAQGGVLRGPLEDWASARLVFENGVIADVASSRVMSDAARRTRMFAPGAVVEIDFGSRKRVETKGRELERIEHQGSAEEPLRRELEHFVQCVREGVRPRVSEREGLAAIEIAHQVLSRIRG
jgi:predicted dehydrogenase